jgi:hypothetical protein
MKYLTTIILAVAFAGLAAYLYWVELPAERSQSLTRAQEDRLLPFEEQEITGLTVRTEAGEVVLEPGERRTWKIAAPLRTDADSREVETLLRALVLGKISRVVEERAAALAPFGLENPPVVLTVSAGSRAETLSLGDSGPVSSTLYAMRASDRKVLLTTLAPKDVLNKTLLTFRKKEVLRFDHTQVDRLRLAYPGSEILLEQQPSGQPGQKDKKRWMVRFPVETQADQVEVRTLLLKLEDFKAVGFVDPGRAHASLLARLTKPDVKITLRTSGIEQTVKLFQLDQASGEAYAVIAPDSPIFRISPMAIKDLSKELFILQDKRLLGVDRDEIAVLAVKTRDERYVLLNQNGQWVLEDQPDKKLQQEAVDIFVSRVVNLPAELRVLKHAGPLAPYGLTSPSAEFIVTGRDGKPRGRLVLGSRDSGLVYAMGHLPGIFQARADILTQIPARRDLLAQSGK